jgi:hypothetical protein
MALEECNPTDYIECMLFAQNMAELESSLRAAVANWDAASAERFTKPVRREIRTEIAREAAVFVSHAHYRNFDFQTLRSLLGAWRHLQELDVKDSAVKVTRDSGVDLAWRSEGRLFIADIKWSILNFSKLPTLKLTSLPTLNFHSLNTNLFATKSTPSIHVADGNHKSWLYEIDYIDDHLSIRDEWRIISEILDKLANVEQDIGDVDLRHFLIYLLKTQVESRVHSRIFYRFKIYKEYFSPSLYEFVRNRMVMSSISPPEPTVMPWHCRNDGRGLYPNDHNERRACNSSPARRKPRGLAHRGSSGTARRTLRTRRRIECRRRSLHRITRLPRNCRPTPALFRGCRDFAMDYVRMASA